MIIWSKDRLCGAFAGVVLQIAGIELLGSSESSRRSLCWEAGGIYTQGTAQGKGRCRLKKCLSKAHRWASVRHSENSRRFCGAGKNGMGGGGWNIRLKADVRIRILFNWWWGNLDLFLSWWEIWSEVCLQKNHHGGQTRLWGQEYMRQPEKDPSDTRRASLMASQWGRARHLCQNPLHRRYAWIYRSMKSGLRIVPKTSFGHLY